ncbi:MAG: NERD domain-containing protein, partial [Elusimicrobia bacterium]|nr:NERD domain-containing protein [Elusimicrobiota bacterium]
MKTRGERQMFRILRELPDNFYVWYEPSNTKHRLDFVVISPENGLIVIEVKDWKYEHLVSCNPKEMELNFAVTKKTEINPAEKTRNSMFELKNSLEANQKLIATEGRYKGRLKFPCTYAVAFTEIERKKFEKISCCFEKEHVFLKEDIAGFQTNTEDLIIRLKTLTSYFGNWAQMNGEELCEIRKILFPEIKVIDLSGEDTGGSLDELQEHYAKNMVFGNVLMGGVAGSGKSLILIFRAKYLTQHFPNWKILIVCYNRTWVSGLRCLMNNLIDKKYHSNIEIKNFHQVAAKLMDKGIRPNELHRDGFDERFGEEFLKYLETHPGKQNCYDAILLDEGQDFKDIWIKGLSKLLKNENSSFIVAYDNAQRIYKTKGSWTRNASLSVSGARHSLFLNHNYRSNREIATLAQSLYSNNPSTVGDKYTRALMSQYKRFQIRGALPELFVDSADNQLNFILSKIKNYIKNKILPREIAILFFKYKNFPYKEIISRLMIE